MITGNDVLEGGSPVRLAYVGGQLSQANNENNKAKLLPTTLDEYKQVSDHILSEETTEHLPRESRNTWMDWGTG